MNQETKQLLRYLDREMAPAEAQRFEARLSESPDLRQKLAEMRRVGALLRVWSNGVQERAAPLLEPTLKRVAESERKSARVAMLGYVVAAALLLSLPWSRHTPAAVAEVPPSAAVKPAGAAIERLEAADKQAQVFVVGNAATPVVWLADDVQDDDEDAHDQDPG